MFYWSDMFVSMLPSWVLIFGWRDILLPHTAAAVAPLIVWQTFSTILFYNTVGCDMLALCWKPSQLGRSELSNHTELCTYWLVAQFIIMFPVVVDQKSLRLCLMKVFAKWCFVSWFDQQQHSTLINDLDYFLKILLTDWVLVIRSWAHPIMHSKTDQFDTSTN